MPRLQRVDMSIFLGSIVSVILIAMATANSSSYSTNTDKFISDSAKNRNQTRQALFEEFNVCVLDSWFVIARLAPVHVY